MFSRIITHWKTSTAGLVVGLCLAVASIWFPSHRTQIDLTAAAIAASGLFSKDPQTTASK